ncbi:MAG TPA: glycosyltransferase family 9 protein [Chthoniobacteraceae bacterium]|nr:glycosyltransferase family 9 protein [Chthoniobacteraceae bacterium]
MRILALQLKRIGDLILTTPALWALRQNFPKATLTLAVEAGSREMLPAIDFVDETLVYERKGNNGCIWKHLLLKYYDTCLDFTGTDRSALFGVLSKAGKRVTFEWVQRSRFRHVFYNQFIASSVRENHTVDHYMHLLRAVDAPVRNGAPIVLHLPEWAPRKARQLLDEAGVTGPFILVHPGTARPEKYWPPERWAEVIRWCGEHLRMPCVLTGSPEGNEQRHIAVIRKACPGIAAQDLSGRLDLLTLAALTRMCALALTVDSAPMHLAGAFGTPQVALFGPTNPFHWRPRHERAIVLQSHGPISAPEFRPQHPGGPMTEISTQAVIDAIVALHVHA